MSKKIAIASGKGGTGKTTVSVNLYHYIVQQGLAKTRLVDCDVEEPNAALFFNNLQLNTETVVNQQIPEIDVEKCTFCRKCADYCEYNAIVILPPVGFAQIDPGLCHSCGACLVACEHSAITEHPQPIGTINTFVTPNNTGLTEGRLKIGSAMQTLLIRELKKSIPNDYELVLFDSPPGTSCPVVESVADTDYVIVVTEPTPFGLHDLKLMVELLRNIAKPFGVVINKAGLGNNDVFDYLITENIELLAEIPFSKEFAAGYAIGEITPNFTPEMELAYKKITQKCLETND